MMFEVAIFGNFPDIPNWNCHFRSGLWKVGCNVFKYVRLAELPFPSVFRYDKHKKNVDIQFSMKRQETV